MPATAGVFKLDQLVASVARETLWVTDAYFVGVSAYINALIAAAQDGVDVRLLVPGTVDVFGVGAMSRAGFRALLEGGVRIFEWNGVDGARQDRGRRRQVGARRLDQRSTSPAGSATGSSTSPIEDEYSAGR